MALLHIPQGILRVFYRFKKGSMQIVGLSFRVEILGLKNDLIVQNRHNSMRMLGFFRPPPS